MLKDILKRYRLHLPTLYMTLGMIWGMAIFGFVLFEIVMKLAIHNGKSPEAFQMAFLMSLMMYIGAAIFTGSITNYTSFNTCISMGCTRKKYILMRTTFLFVNNLLAVLSVYIIHKLENLYLAWHWKDIPLEVDLSILAHPWILFMAWIVGTIFPFFLSALSLHFGKIVTLIIYILWLVVCLSFSRVEDIVHSDNFDSFASFFTTIKPYQWTLILIAICAVLYAIAYKIYKKQAVVA